MNRIGVLAYIEKQIDHIRKGGASTFKKKVIIFINIITRFLSRPLILVIFSPFALILRVLNIRFPNFFVSRIGHLLAEPDCYLKEEHLGIIPKRTIIMLAPKSLVSNQAILSYWRQYYWIIENELLAKILRPFTWNPLTRFDLSRYCVAINDTADFFKIQALWSDRLPLLKISTEDNIRGEKALADMGVQTGAWFVCVHSRDGGYSPSDEHVHSYRNSRFEDYLMAIDYISSLGGVCIAMGDSSMRPIPKIKNLIDYAHHSMRSDWLDLYLAANCCFFLGNSSGAFLMSSLFGVPVACANMAPLSAVFPCGAKDIGIPKLYKETATGRVLSFKEILDTPMGDYRYSSMYNSLGIELIDSSPEDIMAMAIEQFEVIENQYFTYSKEDEELQLRFKALFKPGHYTYGSASRISRAFLKRYEHLLP
jgi:putative glycosyltransferase (TIGR04372 family)